MKRIGQAESDLCPSCLKTEETAPHIFACERRVEWQGTFIDSLRKLLATLHTQPDLKTILLLGISGALQDDPTLEMDTTNREPDFEILVSCQNDIGWSHLLRGCFSHHWVQIQQAHIDKDDEICSKTNSGSGWLKKVLHHIWSHLYAAWLLRNADLHGIDKADQEAKRKAKLRPAIVALYQTSATLTYLDKRLFALPLDKRLDLNSSEQRAWISLVTPTVRQAKAEADDHLRQTQPDIRGFFLRPVPAAPPPPAAQLERLPIPRLRDG